MNEEDLIQKALDRAQEAMDLAKDAHAKHDAHEKICSIRYEGINIAMIDIASVLKDIRGKMWAGLVGLVGILLTIVGTAAWYYLTHK